LLKPVRIKITCQDAFCHEYITYKEKRTQSQKKTISKWRTIQVNK